MHCARENLLHIRIPSGTRTRLEIKNRQTSEYWDMLVIFVVFGRGLQPRPPGGGRGGLSW
jgi:hypothetical protein